MHSKELVEIQSFTIIILSQVISYIYIYILICSLIIIRIPVFILQMGDLVSFTGVKQTAKTLNLFIPFM